MSRLKIQDLEKIKNGKMVRYNELTKENYSSFVSLASIEKQLREVRWIRSLLLKKIYDDMNNQLDFKKGSRIDNTYKVSFNPTKLFLKDYLALTIPSILGDNECLFSKEKMVSSTGFTKDLEEKSNILLPFVKKIFEVKENSHLLDNSFYQEYPVLDLDNSKVFSISGNGVLLPFANYLDLENINLQKLLEYYYKNSEEILSQILIPNTHSLENYRKDIEKEKVFEIYKGVR